MRISATASIEVAVSEDGRQWQSAGTIRHDDLWNPPGDYEPWEHDDRGSGPHRPCFAGGSPSQTRRGAFGVPDPAYAGLPAAGRWAYSFPLVFAHPLAGRHVRFVFAPLDGRGMGVSELQVFKQIEVSPWPADIRLHATLPHTVACATLNGKHGLDP